MDNYKCLVINEDGFRWKNVIRDFIFKTDAQLSDLNMIIIYFYKRHKLGLYSAIESFVIDISIFLYLTAPNRVYIFPICYRLYYQTSDVMFNMNLDLYTEQ